MAAILLILAVTLGGNIWANFWGHKEVKFTSAAQCDGGSIFDPEGCPRPGGTQNGGGVFDPTGAQ